MWDLCIRGGIRPEKHMGNPKLWIFLAVLRWGKHWLKERDSQATPEGSFLSLLPVFTNDLRTEGGGVFRRSH